MISKRICLFFFVFFLYSLPFNISPQQFLTNSTDNPSYERQHYWYKWNLIPVQACVVFSLSLSCGRDAELLSFSPGFPEFLFRYQCRNLALLLSSRWQRYNSAVSKVPRLASSGSSPAFGTGGRFRMADALGLLPRGGRRDVLSLTLQVAHKLFRIYYLFIARVWPQSYLKRN